MTAALLDTSALLAHYLMKPGFEVVRDWIASGDAAVAAPTCFEFRTRLLAIGLAEPTIEAALDRYRMAFCEVVPVDEDVARRAWLIRRATPARIPAVDALIAACAQLRAAVLVHDDVHMAAIPSSMVTQTRIRTARV